MSGSNDDGASIASMLNRLTEEQRLLVNSRLKQCQSQFRAYNSNQEKQKIEDIRFHHPEMTPAGIDIALESCRGNEIMALHRLATDKEYHDNVMGMADGSIEKDIDSIMAYDRKRELAELLMSDSNSEREDSDSDSDSRGHKRSELSKRRRMREKSKEKRCPRLLLNDAMSKLFEIHSLKDKKVKEPTVISDCSTSEDHITLTMETTRGGVAQTNDEEETSSIQPKSETEPLGFRDFLVKMGVQDLSVEDRSHSPSMITLCDSHGNAGRTAGNCVMNEPHDSSTDLVHIPFESPEAGDDSKQANVIRKRLNMYDDSDVSNGELTKLIPTSEEKAEDSPNSMQESEINQVSSEHPPSQSPRPQSSDRIPKDYVVKPATYKKVRHTVVINRKKLKQMYGTDLPSDGKTAAEMLAEITDFADEDDDERMMESFLLNSGVSIGELEKLGWSVARIKAFKNRRVNPNMYYYRFNDPWIPQKTGGWNKAEQKLFLKLIEENGVDYEWGTFSMSIPGRVGYQCSNYYRGLVKEGIIEDHNYSVGENGELKFLFKNKQGQSVLRRSHRECVHVKTSQSSKRSKKSKNDISDESDSPVPERKLYKLVEEEAEEPIVDILPGYIDPMTMEPVEKPAISPYGHVMGYDSWVKILNRKPRDTCPFTKRKITRRSLVKLTIENIEEYRSKIINANGLGVDLSCEDK